MIGFLELIDIYIASYYFKIGVDLHGNMDRHIHFKTSIKANG